MIYCSFLFSTSFFSYWPTFKYILVSLFLEVPCCPYLCFQTSCPLDFKLKNHNDCLDLIHPPPLQSCCNLQLTRSDCFSLKLIKLPSSYFLSLFFFLILFTYKAENSWGKPMFFLTNHAKLLYLLNVQYMVKMNVLYYFVRMVFSH